MNKFYDLCFKFGKGFMGVVLVLIALAVFYFIYSATANSLKINSYKMDYKFPVKTSVETKGTKQIPENNYKDEIIKAFGENKPTDRFINTTVNFINNEVKKDDINDFISNLPAYYDDAKNEIRELIKAEYKMSDKKIDEDYKKGRNEWDDIILKEKYFVRYHEQIKAREEQKFSAETQRNLALISLLTCLCMFVMFLTVPLLIKIEENTRK